MKKTTITLMLILLCLISKGQIVAGMEVQYSSDNCISIANYSESISYDYAPLMIRVQLRYDYKGFSIIQDNYCYMAKSAAYNFKPWQNIYDTQIQYKYKDFVFYAKNRCYHAFKYLSAGDYNALSGGGGYIGIKFNIK